MGEKLIMLLLQNIAVERESIQGKQNPRQGKEVA